MSKLCMTVGPSASGKSTWARQSGYERVCRDDIREWLSAPFMTDENAVTDIEDRMLASHLSRGNNVVCDATNLRPKYIKHKIALARKHDAEIWFRLFDVEPKVLLKRNEQRPESERIPEDVIKRQYNTFRSNLKRGCYTLAHYPDPTSMRKFELDPDNPDTVVFDIDGTVALHTNPETGEGRSPYDYDKVSDDYPNGVVIDMVRKYARSHSIVFMSGRPETCKKDTVSWINKHIGVPYEGPYMRPEGDNRKDSIVKHELFTEHVEPSHNVVMVVDDRTQVVDMWRACGLLCVQVAEGNF